MTFKPGAVLRPVLRPITSLSLAQLFEAMCWVPLPETKESEEKVKCDCLNKNHCQHRPPRPRS